MDIRVINVSKRFPSADGLFVDSLRQITVDVNGGSYITFVGPSGSGKTTLLNVITGLIRPTSGELFWGKYSLLQSGAGAVRSVRKRLFGIVPQEASFVDELNAEENILLPVIINQGDLLQGKRDLSALKDRLGIKNVLRRYPDQLSGGERRRIALARALIIRPEILVADEPTANLDEVSSREVFRLFQQMNKSGMTVVLATHDERFGKFCRESYYLRDGRIEKFSGR